MAMLRSCWSDLLVLIACIWGMMICTRFLLRWSSLNGEPKPKPPKLPRAKAWYKD